MQNVFRPYEITVDCDDALCAKIESSRIGVEINIYLGSTNIHIGYAQIVDYKVRFALQQELALRFGILDNYDYQAYKQVFRL